MSTRKARARLAAGLLLFGLAGLAGAARADVLDVLTANAWGHDLASDASCLNPHRFSLEDGGRRLVVTWDSEITDYEGQRRRSGGYEIVGEGETSLTLKLEGESRLGADGQPVTWVLELLPTGIYCWRTTEEPFGACTHPAMACPAPPSLS
ncbi:hypothetical protein [Pseudoroseicyclus sp. CXY001]|uniref:hypothetical protein n=1 Tax=Pseudoroseicyclus sp. CXY001 TaxID=3242492 RepID=UPI003571518E